MTGHFDNWRRFADSQIDSATDDDTELDFVMTTIPGAGSEDGQITTEAEAAELLQAYIDRLPARRWPRWMLEKKGTDHE